MIELRRRFDLSFVLFSSESATTIREALVEAVKAGADLAGADLVGADLGGADLGGADLAGAHLGGADLGGAHLGGAYLAGAHLGGAYLAGADLVGADLGGAHLGGAYLVGARLAGANLAGADLRGVNLVGADLGGAYLAGASLNWNSHDLISEILFREAESDVEKRKVAGLILISRDWCWKDFLRFESGLRDWAMDVLARRVVDGDNSPAILKRLARKPAE